MKTNHGAMMTVAVALLMLCTVIVPMAPSSYASSADMDITTVDYWEGKVYYEVETDSPYIYIQIRDTDGRVVYLGPNPDVTDGKVSGSFTKQLDEGTYVFWAQGPTSDIWDSKEFVTHPVVMGIDAQASRSILVGDTVDIAYDLEPWNAGTRDVSLRSSDESVVIVNQDNTITGISAGVAYVTVTTVDGGLTDVCTVTVKEPAGTYVDLVSVEYYQGSIHYKVESDCGYIYVQVRGTDGDVMYLGPNPDVIGGNVEAVFDHYLLPGEYVLYVQGPSADVYDSASFITETPVDQVFLQSSKNMLVGDKASLSYTVGPWNAADKTVTWSSSDTSVVTIDDQGLITAVSTGVAYVTVTTVDGGFTDVCTVTVDDEPGTYLDITSVKHRGGVTYYEVDTDCTYVYVQVRDTSGAIVYMGPNPDVTDDRLSSQFTKALEPGRYILYVQGERSSVNDSMEFTVYEDLVLVESIVLGTDVFEAVVGETFSIDYSYSPEDASGPVIIWTVSDDSILHVDAEGNITALSAGTAIVTVTADGASDTCTITVTGTGEAEVDKDGNVSVIEKEVTEDANGNTVEKVTVDTTNKDGTTTSTTTVTITDAETGVRTEAVETVDKSGNVSSVVESLITPSGKVTSNEIDRIMEHVVSASSSFESEPQVILGVETDSSGDVMFSADAFDGLEDVKVEVMHEDISFIFETKVLSSERDDVTVAIDADRSAEAPSDKMLDIVSIKVDLYIGDKGIHDLGGTVTIHVPYALEEGIPADSVGAWYVSDGGIIQKVDCIWVDGVATLEVDHFSHYIVGIDDGWEPERGDGSMILAVAIVGIIGIIACMVIPVIRKH